MWIVSVILAILVVIALSRMAKSNDAFEAFVGAAKDKFHDKAVEESHRPQRASNPKPYEQLYDENNPTAIPDDDDATEEDEHIALPPPPPPRREVNATPRPLSDAKQTSASAGAGQKPKKGRKTPGSGKLKKGAAA